MSGYRQDNFDLSAEEPADRGKKGSWWKHLLGFVAYGIPLIWLWIRTDYPDSFGVQITAHGRVGGIERWFYSYLLLERHHILDVFTFVYMWVPIIGYIGWIAYPSLRKFKFSLYADDRDLGR
jgi:hypothetical protein